MAGHGPEPRDEQFPEQRDLLGSRQIWPLTSEPSAFAECRKIDTRRGIPATLAISGTKLQGDLLVAVGNPQRRLCCRLRLGGRRCSRGSRLAFPGVLLWSRRSWRK